MPAPWEYCPRCRRLRPARVSVTQRRMRPGQKPEGAAVRSYHCTVCGGFVRRERVDVEVEVGEGEEQQAPAEGETESSVTEDAR